MVSQNYHPGRQPAFAFPQATGHRQQHPYNAQQPPVPTQNRFLVQTSSVSGPQKGPCGEVHPWARGSVSCVSEPSVAGPHGPRPYFAHWRRDFSEVSCNWCIQWCLQRWISQVNNIWNCWYQHCALFFFWIEHELWPNFAQIFVAVKIFRMSTKADSKQTIRDVNRVGTFFHVACNFLPAELLLAPYTGVWCLVQAEPSKYPALSRPLFRSWPMCCTRFPIL